MRIKVRYTNGSAAGHVLTISNTEPISALLTQIKQHGGISETADLQIKHGFPPKPLELDALPLSTPLNQLPFPLDGQQLLVTADTTEPSPATSSIPSRATKPLTKPKPVSTTSPFAPPTKKPTQNPDDPPDVLIPGRGTVVLRVMEDDNSCLFRAISYVCTNSLYSVTELRQLVASTIQSDPITYSEIVLGRPVDQYCQWITRESSWGGGIEMSILAQFFDIEIIAYDVSTSTPIRFNEPSSASNPRHKICLLVYSGIHYDAIALSPITAFSFQSPPDQDVRIFDSDDAEMLQAASELVVKLKQRNYFTDTSNFTLRCEVCRKALRGEKEAVLHAERTGHQDFGEY